MSHPFEPLQIPDAVRRRAETTGQVGEAWLAALPDLATHLAERWSLTLGKVMTGGTEGLVLAADSAEYGSCVLKLSPPTSETADLERRVLLAAEGRGYARVRAHAVEDRALLLERLGAPLAEAGLPLEAQLDALCATLARAWVRPASTRGYMTGAEKAESLIGFIEALWVDLGRPAGPIDAALRAAEVCRSDFDPDSSVLAHGDPHPWNALEDPEAPGSYRFVDPEGLFIEPAYDLGVCLRGGPGEPLAKAADLARRRCRRLADFAGAPPDAVWRWALVERVSTGLLCLQLGLDGGAEMLAVAEAWAAA